MEVIVRKAIMEDGAAVIKLLYQIAEQHQKGRADLFKEMNNKYSINDFYTKLDDDRKPMFVAVDENNNVLSYVFCMIINYKNHYVFNDYRSLYIDDICVDEHVRRQKIGTLLMDSVCDFARKTGCYNIDLNVWEFNEGAKSFYKKYGLKTQRRRMELIL